MTALAAFAAAAWAYLLLFHGGFWRARETDAAAAAAPAPAEWPTVVAVVPARDEAAVIGLSLASLLAQNYPGHFRIVLVDDNSTDATATIARATPHPCYLRLHLPLPQGERVSAGQLPPSPLEGEGNAQRSGARERERGRLTILHGTPLPPNWTGKLHAVAQGIAAAPDAAYLWLTDADIAHAPDTLASLVARATADTLVLGSLMARLRTATLAERAIVPAFVFFFQMLYPFSRVNRPANPIAAAAGGCMLIRADALARAGGIASIRGALIDDCAMGRLMKRQGPIRLSLTHRSVSLRAYSWRELWAMIARSAYAQLGYSPWLLAGAVAAMAAIFFAPPLLALTAASPARALGAVAWAAMALAFQPMLRFYRLSPLWAVAIPLIAAFYLAATIASALQHWRGQGGMWKGRAQATRTARATA